MCHKSNKCDTYCYLYDQLYAMIRYDPIYDTPYKNTPGI